MTTITEYYVSFETAKLLKEKGFDGSTMFSYSDKGVTMVGHWENNKDWSPKSTLQMAKKWLKEVHNLFISPSVTYIGTTPMYYCHIINLETMKAVRVTDKECYYDDCLETAIKICLNELVS